MSARYDRLLRIADRLGKASVGSAEADTAIYEALRLTGPVLPYTTDVVRPVVETAGCAVQAAKGRWAGRP